MQNAEKIVVEKRNACITEAPLVSGRIPAEAKA